MTNCCKKLKNFCEQNTTFLILKSHSLRMCLCVFFNTYKNGLFTVAKKTRKKILIAFLQILEIYFNDGGVQSVSNFGLGH